MNSKQLKKVRSHNSLKGYQGPKNTHVSQVNSHHAENVDVNVSFHPGDQEHDKHCLRECCRYKVHQTNYLAQLRRKRREDEEMKRRKRIQTEFEENRLDYEKRIEQEKFLSDARKSEGSVCNDEILFELEKGEKLEKWDEKLSPQSALKAETLRKSKSSLNLMTHSSPKKKVEENYQFQVKVELEGILYKKQFSDIETSQKVYEKIMEYIELYA